MRRVIAALAAVVLAALGAVLLIGYVRGADDRALAGLDTVTVLVVEDAVPAGLPAEEVAGYVQTDTLPAMAVVPGALADLAEVAGLVTTTALEPGEQLLASRFADPASLTAPDAVGIPDGLQEVSVLLEPQRVIGGRLTAGQRVGVFLSYQPQVLNYETKMVINSVLVTRVVGAPTSAPSEEDDAAAPAAPTGSIIVSLALNTPDAERLIHGAEHGTVWLSLQPDGTDLEGSEVITPGNIYE